MDTAEHQTWSGSDCDSESKFGDDRLREECGVFGIFNHDEAATITALGLHALQHRLGLETIGGRISSYSGLYTINRADMHPIVGETPVPGFFVANGCSGHGFKLAPAIGALLARRITGESDDFDTAMDPAFLAYDRKPISLSAMNVLA